MRTNTKRWLWGLLGSGLCVAVATADFSADPEAESFVREFSAEEGLDPEWLKSLVEQAEHKQSIIDAMQRAPERTLTWKDYRPIFITDTRIEQGVEFWSEYRDTLERAEREFGVPASVIVAILGIETSYGRNRGGYRVLDALATLAFDYPPRADFFRSELEHYLRLVREQDFDPLTIKGSYAGAMGYGQFISSSYRHYAIDFDDDGVADLIDNPVDAIGSIANYLSEHRWQRGKPIVTRAQLSADADRALLDVPLKPERPLGELVAAGFSSEHVKDMELAAVPFVLEGKWGEEIWLALDNFYVITRYNRSKLYAMAVFDLSRELAQRVE